MRKSINKTINYWSLRKKILIAMFSLLLLSGFSSIFITRAVLLTVLRAEFQHKGLNSARGLAANSIVDVLTQNTSRLKQLIVNEKNLDKDIAYVFIIDSSNRIIAHTFNKGFPVDLAGINNIKPGKPFNAQLLSTQLGLIYDINVPILSERSLLANVRLGLLQNNIQKTTNIINLIFFSITFIIIIIAVILAYKVKRLSVLEERSRIAVDLHDCCAQDLANIIKRIELCEKLFKKEPAKAIEELQELKESARDILNRTREVIFELKSPEGTGFDLLSKLSSYIEDYRKTTDIAVKLEMPVAMDNVPALKAKEIFYIIREVLTNVKKHSQAKNVRVTLKSNGNNNLTADIVDDGKGFDTGNAKLFSASSSGWGIMGMRQRTASLGGALVIDSSPERGTAVSVKIPLVD